MPEIKWLLTDKEIGDKLDLDDEYTYPCSDGSILTTIDCHPVAQAELRHVAEILLRYGIWLKDSDAFQVTFTREEIQALKKAAGL